MLKKFAIALPALAAIALAACGPTSSTSTPHVKLTTRVQCGAQMHTWEKTNHFSALLSQLAQDIRTLPSGSAAGDRAAMKQVTHGLATDATVLQKHMPPNCVPGFDTQLNAGLQQLLNADAASHSTNPASVQQASGDLHAAGTFLRQASQDAGKYAVGK